MKIAFIGPKWNEMVNAYPSLGLGYLAAVAEQDGHECRIFDFGLRPQRSLEEEIRDVVDFGPDLAAFTAMTTSYASIERSAEMLKEALGRHHHHRRPSRHLAPHRDVAESPPRFSHLWRRRRGVSGLRAGVRRRR